MYYMGVKLKEKHKALLCCEYHIAESISALRVKGDCKYLQFYPDGCGLYRDERNIIHNTSALTEYENDVNRLQSHQILTHLNTYYIWEILDHVKQRREDLLENWCSSLQDSSSDSQNLCQSTLKLLCQLVVTLKS